MATISDRQIELLQKIYGKTATDTEIKDFLTLVVTDNVLGMEKLPTVAFVPAELMASTYGMMTDVDELQLSTEVVDDIKKNPQKIADAINTIGHECRHFMRRNANLEDFVTEEARQLQEKIDLESEHYEEASGDFLTSLRVLETRRSQKYLQKYLSAHKEESLAKWYLNLVQEKRDNLYIEIEDSHYLGEEAEIDARYAGLLYTTLIFSRYLGDHRVQKNAKLHKWLAQTKQKSMDFYQEDYDEDMLLSKAYGEFEEAGENISKDFLFDIADKVASLGAKPAKQKTFDALLFLACMHYTKSVEKDALPFLFKWAVQNINSQNADGSATRERVLACALANSIYFDKRNSQEQKSVLAKELLEFYDIHAGFTREQMTADSKIHKFDSYDTFVLHLSAYEDFDLSANIIEKLIKNKRYKEVFDLVDYKKLYRAEIDIEYTLPEEYLEHINILLNAKCSFLSSMAPEFINQKFAHDADAKRLIWFTSAIKKTKAELELFYCCQEEKRQPKTPEELDEFYAYIAQNIEFDAKRLDKIQEQAQQKIEAHPARFASLQKE